MKPAGLYIRHLLLFFTALIMMGLFMEGVPAEDVQRDMISELLERHERDLHNPAAFHEQEVSQDFDNIRINSDTTAELQNEEQIVANPLNPDNLVAVWRDFRLGYRRIGIGYSFDGGFTWEDFLLEDDHYSLESDPGLTVDNNGNFYIVLLGFESTSQPNGLFVQKSTDGGVTWSDSVTVVDNAGPFEDKELIACDRSGGPCGGNLYVYWARFASSIRIMLSRSTDGGSSFQTPVNVTDQGGSYQWPTATVGPGSVLYCAWADLSRGRISFDISRDGGVTFGTDRVLSNVQDPYTTLKGGIDVFSFAALEADITGGPYRGNVYAAYMDVGTDGKRDIFFRRSIDEGDTWSSPILVNDEGPNGTDQFHPWMTIGPDGIIYVVFLDRRHDPNNLLYDCYIAQSRDGGLSFEPNLRISTVSSNPNNARAGLLGEYIGIAAIPGSVHPVWTDTRNGHQDAYTSVVPSQGLSDLAIAVAPGAGPGAPGDVQLFYYQDGSTGPGFNAYGTLHYGVNLATVDVQGDSREEIITGPGPGPGFGPQVRGFDQAGNPISGMHFFAYGIRRYGVYVGGADFDGDTVGEIVTGPGPGAVFGPHVRIFRKSGITWEPVPGTDFLAYGTRKFGCKVGAGDLDGDGTAEIVTGAGAGAVYGPHVRGFDVHLGHSGGSIAPIQHVSFFAYGTKKWGVNPCCGDLDGDGYAEILTGPGPGDIFGPHVRGWNYDGGAITQIGGINFFAFHGSAFGVNVAAGDMDRDGYAEFAAGKGPGPDHTADVRAFDYDNQQVAPIAWLDLTAFPSEIRYGARVAAFNAPSARDSDNPRD